MARYSQSGLSVNKQNSWFLKIHNFVLKQQSNPRTSPVRNPIGLYWTLFFFFKCCVYFKPNAAGCKTSINVFPLSLFCLFPKWMNSQCTLVIFGRQFLKLTFVLFFSPFVDNGSHGSHDSQSFRNDFISFFRMKKHNLISCQTLRWWFWDLPAYFVLWDRFYLYSTGLLRP